MPPQQSSSAKVQVLVYGGVVDAWRHALREQVHEESFLAGRGRLQELDELAGLLGALLASHV